MKKVILAVIFGMVVLGLAGCLASSTEVQIKLGSEFRYDQAEEYIELMADKSLLVKLDSQGKVIESIAWDQPYSQASMTPDGTRILCKSDFTVMGEAWQSGYVVIDLSSGGQFKAPTIQSGMGEHSILTNSMIGYAFFDTIALYDLQYQPININLPFDQGAELAGSEEYFRCENYITGIAFDEEKQQFIVSWAINLSSEEFFALNQIGISIYDYAGQLLEQKKLPEAYMSPYSRNYRHIMPNRIEMMADGWLLLEAMDKDYQSLMLLLNLETDEVQAYPFSYNLYHRIFAKEQLIFTSSDEKLDADSTTLLVNISGGQAAAIHTFPSQLTIEADVFPAQSEMFYPYDAVFIDRNRGYIAASSDGNTYNRTTGLFYWEKDKYTLIHQLPLASYFNLIGTDAQGNCLLWIGG